MRRIAALTFVLTASLAAVAPAVAAPQRISADPAVLNSDEIQTVRGRGWPVFENCSRTVRLSVRSAQNAAPVGRTRVGDRGRFRFRWIPDNKNIGPGSWRLVARMRCESGKDGSIFFVRARTSIRIR